LTAFAGKEHGRAFQDQQFPDERKPRFPEPDEDPRLPDGKSQKNAIAKQQHEQALKDADELVSAAQDLRDQIKQAGNFVVPLGSVKKTEEIEKLARRIRGRLKS
jgi:hypothetical protein